MRYNLRPRCVLAATGTVLLIAREAMSIDTEDIWSEEVIKESGVSGELLKNFYPKNHTDALYEDMKDSVNTIWIITAAVNIIAMQLGFSFLEVGSIHPKNKANILIKNLLDTYIGALAFYALGFAFANEGGGGVIGSG